MKEINNLNTNKSEDISINQLSSEEIAKQEEKEQLKKKVDELWKQTGWHRPLAGFWFNYILLLVIAIPAVLMVTLLNLVLPYPEALGFNSIVTGLLLPIYTLADFGIRNASERYIAQYAEVEPQKALKYVSFFIWYQMISGLLQVTIISIVAVTIIPYTNMSFAVWFFLVFIMIQWPGTAGIFLTALGGFQQFDKQNVIIVIQNVAIQTLTQVGFIVLGRWIGSLNPAIGELMGAVMGFILGSYLDDLLAMFIGAYFLKNSLKSFGIKLKEVLFITFDRKIIKEVLLYGGKVLPAGLVYYIVSAAINLMLAAWLWNYSTLLGLYTIASGIIGALGVSFSNGPPIAEAYNNEKKELTLFYIRSQFQWWGILSVGVLMGPLLFLIPNILGYIGAEYAEAAPMMFPLFVGAWILFPSNFSATVCEACDRPQNSTYCNFIEQGTRFTTYLLIFAPWGVATWFGSDKVFFFWLLAESPGYALKGIYGWYIVKKKLFTGMKIGFPLYQTLLAPALALAAFTPLYFLMSGIFSQVFLWSDIAGYGLAVLYLISVLFVFPIYLFMPLYGFLGAWDEKSLDDFRKSTLMAGPSKRLVTALYRSAKFGYERSPFKGKFVIPYEIAEQQALEITNIREKVEARREN